MALSYATQVTVTAHGPYVERPSSAFLLIVLSESSTRLFLLLNINDKLVKLRNSGGLKSVYILSEIHLPMKNDYNKMACSMVTKVSHYS